MISKLIAALQKADLDLTAEDIADMLWLSLQMGSGETKPLPDSNMALSTPAAMTPPGDTNTFQELIPRILEQKSTVELEAMLYLFSDKAVDMHGSSLTGILFRSPAALVLPGTLDIARSLRPFMRRVPSRTECIVDEKATAQRIAEEDIWIPVLYPAPARWFEVALVLDNSTSMNIWRHTITEFQNLLEHHGAFSNVRSWHIITDDSRQVLLYEGVNVTKRDRQLHNPRELNDPSGRRLIFVVTDCVSPAWYSGAIQQVLSLWSQSNTVSIIQVLSRRLWPRTALSAAAPVMLQTPFPGAPNRKLKAQSSEQWPDEKPLDGLPIPIVTLEPRSLAVWAHMMVGEREVWTPGYVFDINTPEENHEKSQSKPLVLEAEQKHYSARESVQGFQAIASPIAQKLATLLSAAPISLPIIRLLQQTMLPESRQIHVAEVLLGGLLEEIEL